MSQRFEGKNLDDALTAATQAFGVERFQLTYHVLLERRGFLGGVKRVVIEADRNIEATAPPQPQQVAAPSTSRPPASSRGERGGGRERGGRRDGGRPGGNRDRDSRGGGGRRG